MPLSLTHKAGRPLHAAIPWALTTAALLGGSGWILVAGGAKAQALTPCSFGNAAGTACLTDVWYDTSLDTSPQPTDKQIKLITLPTLGSGDIEFLWNPINPPAGFAADTWDVDVDFTPDIVATSATGDLTGTFEYTIKIDEASPWTFRDVQLDATGTSPYSVNKTVYADASFTTLLADLEVPPGPDGPSAGVAPLKQVWVRNIYGVNPTGTLDNFQDTYRQEAVPGPLPIVGAGMAFGFSRRLRRRIKAGASV